MFAMAGQGDLDFGPIACYVTASDYRGWVVLKAEQDAVAAAPGAAIATALETLSAAFAGSS